MSKAIFLTKGQQAFNALICEYLLEQGHRVSVLFDEEAAAQAYYEQTPAEVRDRLHVLTDEERSLESIAAVVEMAQAKMEGLDVLIHGNELLDEEAAFESDPVAFGEDISEVFRQIHLFNRAAAGLMLKRKSGSIIFPIFYDALYYAGYPSSPILNHGKISLMKCMSRELAAFKLSVNTMTFGYYDDNFDKQTKKERKEALEIYGLKPTLMGWKEMIPALDILVNPPVKNIGGQDFHISAGIETGL